MTVINWRDSYNTGIQQFDSEHHKIVELINAMFEAIRDNKSKEIFEQIVTDVLLYIDTHFSHEEQAMASANYSGLEEQLREHSLLREEVGRFKSLISSDFPHGIGEFYRFLREWLLHHILECDKKYAPYLQDLNLPE